MAGSVSLLAQVFLSESQRSGDDHDCKIRISSIERLALNSPHVRTMHVISMQSRAARSYPLSFLMLSRQKKAACQKGAIEILRRSD